VLISRIDLGFGGSEFDSAIITHGRKNEAAAHRPGDPYRSQFPAEDLRDGKLQSARAEFRKPQCQDLPSPVPPPVRKIARPYSTILVNTFFTALGRWLTT